MPGRVHAVAVQWRVRDVGGQPPVSLTRRSRPGPRPKEGAVHARLTNWGHWARGGIPGFALLRRDPVDERPTVDEADAQAVEAVLVRMKARRRDYWRIVRWTYVYRWHDATIEQVMRVTDRQLRDLRTGMLTYVAGALECGADLPEACE